VSYGPSAIAPGESLLHQRNLIAQNVLGFDIFIDASGAVSSNK
jgi:hypothetical protein